ncbi:MULTISPECIES: TIGR03751 family conjugal transfer lipoprotein [Stutzerimonas]|jgi:conjugative transfer region lipoprotein (TIGR03751 family)|uniref:TIGR03751 family conjugal transfer lipoprotein n=1 Tax=Stutzerimonas TaxID=2901164 RepID=UPI000C6580BE|nr:MULTISPECIES: TIGR03751 family conjugal transfer lipoprotein [Stutzerimonas]MAF88600.1 TIGR03751 family conjugal transfer lipoprotein [Pseudomonas sp.]MBT1119278.1 TIGR03751 family conjugal transfer lipoprotein [Stutzerimonas nitrititolerans]RRV44711.1 TIGR03751 family conjugal transfer lipoprotein [Stutzerimonas stutzeri]RRV52097.1 TIGR03751 family conjugal transfer lipoprotein [Stutzerimonas stutzeri]|tara:strand:- start:7765 stop:8193 length:429 start_codon:yes stop_codon:yes gene_type:complete
MLRRSIEMAAVIAVIAAALQGCTTTKDEMLPHGEETMMDVWLQSTGGGAGGIGERKLLDARQDLRRTISTSDSVQEENARYTRTAQNEIYSQFKRLPNPDLVMYVYPHLAGTDPAPIPGYSTVFPLYQRVQYAMPGERTEDY